MLFTVFIKVSSRNQPVDNLLTKGSQLFLFSWSQSSAPSIVNMAPLVGYDSSDDDDHDDHNHDDVVQVVGTTSQASPTQFSSESRYFLELG